MTELVQRVKDLHKVAKEAEESFGGVFDASLDTDVTKHIDRAEVTNAEARVWHKMFAVPSLDNRATAIRVAIRELRACDRLTEESLHGCMRSIIKNALIPNWREPDTLVIL